jgi:hypothetical protein
MDSSRLRRALSHSSSRFISSSFPHTIPSPSIESETTSRILVRPVVALPSPTPGHPRPLFGGGFFSRPTSSEYAYSRNWSAERSVARSILNLRCRNPSPSSLRQVLRSLSVLVQPRALAKLRPRRILTSRISGWGAELSFLVSIRF